MRIKVLGSAAGGGFPQWNCACSNCFAVRAGTFRGRARTQTQLAFSINSKDWFLLNASPDLREQILSTRDLAPPRGSRRSPIAGVFLTSADADSVTGLLHLRESTPLSIFSTPAVQRILKEENSLFRVLNRASPPAQWRAMSAEPQVGPSTDGGLAGDAAFRYSAIWVGGYYPDYLSCALRSKLATQESNVGLLFEHGKKRVIFAPSVARFSDELKNLAESCDLVFLDGTFWSDEELVRATGSGKSARDIGHVPLSGEDGLLQQFSKGARGRRILIHINNTNPILDEESAEHRLVREAGWGIAYDGMEFTL
jgi:pyrroloquinoline quinone biosynthesis protein B